MNNQYYVNAEFYLDVDQQTYENRQIIKETVKDIIKTYLCDELNKKGILSNISKNLEEVKISMQ